VVEQFKRKLNPCGTAFIKRSAPDNGGITFDKITDLKILLETEKDFDSFLDKL
jgi:hypothetical protein